MGAKESDIQKLIMDWLAANKYYHWRNYVGPIIRNCSSNVIAFSRNPAAGMPDIMGLLKNGSGRLFAIEVKTKTGVISPRQRERLEKLIAHGSVAFVARDLRTVINELKIAEKNMA